jgi:predicted nucleic acid-binding protein
MSGVFADTAFYVAAANPRDSFHEAALALADQFDGLMVTTELVLLEVANFFTPVGKRQTFVDLVKDLRASHDNEVVPASAELFDRGLALFASRPDKAWSLTDCTSFVVMHDFGLTDALATDRHFGQAGFRALMRPRE